MTQDDINKIQNRNMPIVTKYERKMKRLILLRKFTSAGVTIGNGMCIIIVFTKSLPIALTAFTIAAICVASAVTGYLLSNYYYKRIHALLDEIIEVQEAYIAENGVLKSNTLLISKRPKAIKYID